MIEDHAQLLISTVDSALLAGHPVDDTHSLTLHLNNHKLVTGYAVCNKEGCLSRFGENILSSSINTGEDQTQLFNDETRMEVTRKLQVQDASSLPHWIILRIDSSNLRGSVTRYLWNIIGLISIISVFVTIATLIGVAYIVIKPILRLKNTMCMAMEDPTTPANFMLETQVNDEIADLTQTYNRLLFDLNHYQEQLTESKREVERGLSSSEARWKFALEGSGDGIWDWSPKSDYIFFSKQIVDRLGYEEGEFEETMTFWGNLIHPDDVGPSTEAILAHLKGETEDYHFEHRVRHKDGHWVWILSRGMVINRDASETAIRVVGTHTDISSHKETEALIWRQANLDLLTELPNRRLFQENLCKCMDNSRKSGLPMVLMFLDLDNFKIINDTHGHKTGDTLLQQTAQRLRDCTRDGDIISRLGGDEFTIILENVQDDKIVTHIAENVLQELARPFQISMEMFHITASIGITYYPHDAINHETLLMNADQAMYAAKEQGRNRYCNFTQAMRTRAQIRMRTINELRTAVNEEQFEVYYQPIVDMTTGRIVKAETLIRWQHPKYGLLGADSVIRLAEETSMIVDIGNWIFYKSAEQLAIWRDKYDPELKISVNTSASQYRDEGCVVEAWFNHMEKIGLPKDVLIVEITESMMLDFNQDVTNKLDAFRNAGVQIALDDFGTGYSSLSYLQQLNSDFLKIDRSFVSNITENERNMLLCREIINIAHIFGMEVIAEGIETIEQAKLLAASGCDYGQGYLYSKPISAREYEDLLIHQSSKAHKPVWLLPG
ncbi:GGDEF domain-containing phosphodiesterase [Leucothrix pacifica]|nr:GGDEF domain-containing phosphodiesterase [Leucothrix pacifica]